MLNLNTDIYIFNWLNLQVSVLGFGCGGLSGMLNAPLSHEAGCDLIKEVYNKGITFFDTADVYGQNDNEIMIGKVFQCQFKRYFHLSFKSKKQRKCIY